MKNSEVQSLTAGELQVKINDEKANLQRLKFAHAISSVENPMLIRTSRKLIARLNTEVTAKSKA